MLNIIICEVFFVCFLHAFFCGNHFVKIKLLHVCEKKNEMFEKYLCSQKKKKKINGLIILY